MAETMDFKSSKKLDLDLNSLASLQDDTLLSLVQECESDFFELINCNFTPSMSSKIKKQIISIILRILKILQPTDKNKFIRAGLHIWFCTFVPTVMMLISHDNGNIEIVEVLETLCEEFGNIPERCQLMDWQYVLENVRNVDKYPKILKCLLESNSPVWHRIWIAITKMLNQQLTVSVRNKVTPLNSMLPVVEAAFKMDTTNRCRAFLCWDVLIENFSNEINNPSITKRLKLLIVPLRVNNVKVTETAQAKFFTWWKFIRTFQSSIENFFINSVTLFLQFCFGSSSSNNLLIPGQISYDLKMQCVEAFVELTGHVYCEGCTTLPKLNGRLICTTSLVNYWSDWIHALRSAVLIIAKENKENSSQQVKCIWKSYLLTIGELPNNSVRKDMVMGVLSELDIFVQECKNNNDVADKIFNSIIISSFDDEEKIKPLFSTIGKENPSLYKIISLMMDKSFTDYFNSITPKEVVRRLDHVMDVILDESINSPSHFVQWALKDLPVDDNMLIFWTALAKNLCEYDTEISTSELCNMLLWPLTNKDKFTDVKLATLAWHILYNTMYDKIMKTDINEQLFKLLEVSENKTCLELCTMLAILKSNMNENGTDYEQKVDLLQKCITSTKKYEEIKEIYTTLLDILALLLNYLTTSRNEYLAQKVLECVKIILLKTDVTNQHLKSTESLITSVSELFKQDLYLKHLSIIQNELQLFMTKNSTNDSLNDVINTVLNRPNIKMNDSAVTSDEIIVENIETPAISNVKDKIHKTQFTKPKIPNNTNKKEPSIVSTVVENGEEYVVVKSNWKFNPRKLTENQKEKLQKKREDIPALYQDLSQSQDDFKNTLWKSDSQDTSTSSKSASNDSVSMLKQIVSSDVVPKIMKTMLDNNISENDPKDIKGILSKVTQPAKNSKNSPKNSITQSIRYSLKDIVSRNVKKLTEKSAADPNETISEVQVHGESSTPQSKTKGNNVVNSAPQLLQDRPSRVKRLPKKFNDTEIFSVSKRIFNKEQPRNVAIKSDEVIQNSIISNSQEIIKENTESLQINETANINSDAKICKKPKENIPEVLTISSNSVDEFDDKRNEIAETKGSKSTPMVLQVQLENIDYKQQEKGHNFDEPIKTKPANVLACSNSSSLEQTIEKPTTEDNDYVILNTTPNVSPSTKDNNVTPKETTRKDVLETKRPVEQKSAVKKDKISRIYKALAIDMVEGHPIIKSESSPTGKILPSTSVGKRTSLADKINRSKIERLSAKTKKKAKLNELSANVDLERDLDRSENISDFSQSQELSCSQDIIESSQDSTFTAISIPKKTPIKDLTIKLTKLEKSTPISYSQEFLKDSECQIIESDSVKLNKIKKNTKRKIVNELENSNKVICDSDKFYEDLNSDCSNKVTNQDSKDDTEIPENRTAFMIDNDLTEKMDTEPFEDNILSNDVIIINDEDAAITISSDEIVVGKETQELAEDDTQPALSHDILEICDIEKENIPLKLSRDCNSMDITNCTQQEATKTITESFDKNLSNIDDANDISSPFRDQSQRKQDFLNDTSELSPIKIISPESNNKAPLPDTSSDYIVIKLSTPVQSNGEPFEKNESPEFFTEDKMSPDNRDLSPPRTDTSMVANNTSPSSSLSLNKNRPQVRSGSRAAQMLGLCVPDKLNAIINSERNESQEPKRNSPPNTQARRNLRNIYNTDVDSETTHENENFLRFKRKLPAVDSSPSGPILKRKHIEIVDDNTVSPAGKRKRVSFHDPPVSTTVTVQKYIEPCGLRSPQNSARKILEKQLRSHTQMKSPKRLDSVFKLHSVLNRAVESFTDLDLVASNDDNQSISLEPTPAVEIVRASELNDKDPICPVLVNCKDSIDNIAVKLSSTTAKSWLLKEFHGKIETVGDLAKMTELEVNRLCIKAPKVKTAKRVLAEYAARFLDSGTNQSINETDNNNIHKKDESVLNDNLSNIIESGDVECVESLPIDDMDTEPDGSEKVEVISKCVPEIFNVEVQTYGVELNETAAQTVGVSLVQNSSQTHNASTSHISVQTNETGEKSTADIISMCLNERNDFVHQLSEQMNESAIEKLTEKLPVETITEWILKRLSNIKYQDLNNEIEGQNLSTQSHQLDDSIDESVINYLITIISHFTSMREPRKMFAFCSELFKKASEINDKPV